jgi:predicted ribosomally synthesized peptide with nif11-like leader
MAKETVAVFLQRLAEDDALREAYAVSLKTATENAMLEVARSAGLEFTVEELREVFAERAAELSEGQLSQVAGGVGTYGGVGMYDRAPGEYDRAPGTYEFHPSGIPSRRL